MNGATCVPNGNVSSSAIAALPRAFRTLLEEQRLMSTVPAQQRRDQVMTAAEFEQVRKLIGDPSFEFGH
jgi:hypothetical protein